MPALFHRRLAWLSVSVLPTVAVLLLVGGPFVYIHLIEGTAPAPLTLSSPTASGASGDSSGAATTDAKRIELYDQVQKIVAEEAPYITGHPVIIDGGEIAGGLASR